MTPKECRIRVEGIALLCSPQWSQRAQQPKTWSIAKRSGAECTRQALSSRKGKIVCQAVPGYAPPSLVSDLGSCASSSAQISGRRGGDFQGAEPHLCVCLVESIGTCTQPPSTPNPRIAGQAPGGGIRAQALLGESFLRFHSIRPANLGRSASPVGRLQVQTWRSDQGAVGR